MGAVMTWRKILTLAMVALAVTSSPAYAGKKHAKAPPKNGGLYTAPVPTDNPGRITAIMPAKLSSDPDSPFAPDPPAKAKATATAAVDLEPAPEPKHFAISEMNIPSLFH